MCSTATSALVAGAVLRAEGGRARHRARGGACASAAGRSGTASCVGIAAAAFVAIFLFDVPFPLDRRSRPALIGYRRRPRAGRVEAGPAAATAARRQAAVADDDSLLGDGAARSCPADRPRGAGAIAAIWLALWLVPVAALVLLCSGRTTSSAGSRVFFSQMAVVTFGGAYAVLAYVAQAAVETYGWLAPGEMLDGLGMAETTPGPLIMVLQFVGFMAAFRDPGALSPLLAGTLGGLLDDLGHLRALLPVDLPRRALCRAPARQPGAAGGARGDHGGGRRRDREPRDLVRAAHDLRRRSRKAGLGPSQLDVPVLASVSWPALLLALVATIAVLRLQDGLATTLLGCGLAGLAVRMAA